MVEESWQLKQGDRLVGTLILEEIDMFWSGCRFEPAPAWEDLRLSLPSLAMHGFAVIKRPLAQLMRRSIPQDSSSSPAEAGTRSQTF
ncbi:hypothetical protein OG196_00645 [Kitasatospora purpeofusca]|uniref:hypothetical protein n=1 Tax=Kitasatospora purpeofusca TaxID=67352 RepID=UPI002E157BFF|nr:hypothetical protein OG196_00645 [Kitasatospora purpeofusca]